MTSLLPLALDRDPIISLINVPKPGSGPVIFPSVLPLPGLPSVYQPRMPVYYMPKPQHLQLTYLPCLPQTTVFAEAIESQPHPH